MIKGTIWKVGDGCYRITINDIRYRKIATACICDIDVLFETMEEISKELKEKEDVLVVFEPFTPPED